MRCLDCRFWVTKIADGIANRDWGACTVPNPMYMARCEMGSLWFGGAQIETAPDFGCVQFAAREEEK
jgi:hypothetical protein